MPGCFQWPGAVAIRGPGGRRQARGAPGEVVRSYGQDVIEKCWSHGHSEWTALATTRCLIPWLHNTMSARIGGAPCLSLSARFGRAQSTCKHQDPHTKQTNSQSHSLALPGLTRIIPVASSAPPCFHVIVASERPRKSRPRGKMPASPAARACGRRRYLPSSRSRCAVGNLLVR